MATERGKPRGYFQYLLAIDCETTGLCFNTKNPVKNEKTGEHHQAVSWGIVVADANTLKPVEKLYLEIKWNDNSIAQREKDPMFGKKAEEIHGLTRAHLEKNGVSEEVAVIEIAQLILKYWGPTVTVKCLGHNVHMFDIPFLQDLLERFEIDVSFGNRHYDTNSAGFLTFGTYNSDDLFEMVGFDPRNSHNALDDALMALESARVMKLVFQEAIK